MGSETRKCTLPDRRSCWKRPREPGRFPCCTRLSQLQLTPRPAPLPVCSSSWLFASPGSGFYLDIPSEDTVRNDNSFVERRHVEPFDYKNKGETPSLPSRRTWAASPLSLAAIRVGCATWNRKRSNGPRAAKKHVSFHQGLELSEVTRTRCF